MADDASTEDTSGLEFFTYKSLDDSYSIRILTLEPGTGDEPLPVTRSLHGALRRMRHPARPRRLWADQICINQEDIAERSRQVGLMNAIYKDAQRILVWLGHDDEGVAREAVRHVHWLHGVFADEMLHEAFRLAHSEELLKQSKDPWVPFSKLTKLPWFNRIWIVQEIGTAAPATLYWGDAEVDWEVLSQVASTLNQRYHYLRTRFSILTPNIRYLYRRFVEPEEAYDVFHNRGNFIYELHRARHLLAKDPRDHVYAFLGHFSIHKGSRSLGDIEADYSRSVENVFYDVAARELEGASSLLLLSACHGVPATYRKKDASKSSLPTWVPDWRILPLHLLGSPVTPHRAAGDTLPRLTIDREKRHLRIHGVRVDGISRTSWTFYGKAFQFRNEPSRRLPIEGLWHDVCGYGSFTLDEPYLNGDFAFYALCQTLTDACVGVDRSRPYDSISKMEWLANGAAYLVRAEGGSDVVAPEIRKLARGGDAFKWSHEATLVTRYRKFAVTRGGYFVMGPDSMEEGDAVVVLYGGRTPFVLREVDEGCWNLLGECYVHGLMEGESLHGGESGAEAFTIS